MRTKIVTLKLAVVVTDDEANNGELFHHMEQEDMTLLMRDALGEFCAARGWKNMRRDVEYIAAYVRERYPELPPSRQIDKAAEVFNRCWIADTLKKGEVKIEVRG